MGIEDAARRIAAAGPSPARVARDPVNRPAIRDWLAAIGDDNPVYERDGVAPPAMIQVWTMPGLPGLHDPADPLRAMSGVLDEAGFTSVVATDCAQTYHRYLREGETVAVRGRLTDVTGPKRTALGEGWFVTTDSTWTVDGEPVAEMRFRVLKFRPGTARPAPPPSAPIRPVTSPDTAFFWDGVAAGELRVQRCGDCGALRHPPGPACPWCGALKPEYAVASGGGRIHSYVVHHHPPLPGRRSPVVVALVDLDEGVRMVGELLGVRPDDVRIGAQVRAEFAAGLPAWRPAGQRVLPAWELAVTPTVVVSTALATRDFQDVHHDRDAAVRRGGKDIFLNILTTTGLVQRYVTDWAGPSAVLGGIAIRLGAPCYPGDTLTFTGSACGGEVSVSGRTAAGEHVAGTVRVAS
ncbi:OB-fold domain-containing protein [Actinoplanes sp. KI2]|uniref:OB-fold domain-containing protein n=1 Tax=Actinoplanes sp. KI2 TaxID=2983315 RepID=UPI003983038C